MFEAIRRVAPGNKFSIFTGDVIDGTAFLGPLLSVSDISIINIAAIWEISKSTVTEDLEAFNNQMASRLNSPVYPAIGEWPDWLIYSVTDSIRQVTSVYRLRYNSMIGV